MSIVDRSHKTAKMIPASWIARLQKEWISVALYDPNFRNWVAVLALDADTPVSWARRFSDFRGVCSSLAPMSYNFSSVSTRRLCFCFLYIKSLVDLSLFAKLWFVCLSSRNLRRNFRRHFLAYSYFTYVWYRNTRCSIVYCTETYQLAH
jgi:hypothetical protein